MAAVAPSGAPPLPPPQSQSTPMQVDGSPSNSQAIPRLSWEGDKMFNIYIHDYCNKRGFTNTARELVREADLGLDPAPPINAKQGLLFEWWSVFWVLFQAKSGNANSEDALLYMQHQNTQKARMNAANGQTQPGVPGSLGGQPSQVPPNQPPQQQQQQPGQLPMGRPLNGMPVRPPSAYMNGAMPNGVMNAAMGGQPSQPGQPGQMQGQPSHMSFAGLGGQPNGMPGGQQQSPHGGQQQGPGPQAIPFNPMMSGPRTPMNGHQVPPGQQQGGRAPFTSPQMAHSPQTGGPGGGQPQQGGPGPGQHNQQQQAPMAQLGGPSPQMTPQMNRAMHPPNGAHPQNMGPGPVPMNPPTPSASGPPTPGFTPGGQGPNPGARPPSRARPTPSPSMTPRQPPGAPGGPQHQPQQQQQPQGGMNMMGGMMGMGGMGVPPGMNMGGPGGGGGPGGMPRGMGGMIPHPGGSQEQIYHELISIPQASLKALMQEQGFVDKDVASLAFPDKIRLLQTYRNSMSVGPQGQKVGQPVAGPSGMMMQGQPQQPQPGGPQQQRPGGQQHPHHPARGKRNSTSPAEDDSQPRNESSPPDRKRIKREPQHQGMPPGPYAHLGQPGGPPGSGSPGTPQQQPGQPQNHQMQPSIPQQQMAMLQHQRAQQMSMGMNGAGPSGHPGQPGHQGGHPVSQPPIGVPVMQMGMHGPMPPGLGQQPNHFRPGQPGQPRPGQPTQFNPVPLTHLGKQNPGPQPQQSPGMNGPGKDMKDKAQMQMQLNGQPSGSGPHPGSPRNQPGSAAHTPVPSNQPTPNRPPSGPPGLQGNGQGGPSQPPPQSQPPNQQQGQPQQSQLMNSMLSMPMNGMSMTPGDLSMFDSEFMGIDHFDVFAGKSDGDINFEREFGQWFTHADDPSGSLEK